MQYTNLKSGILKLQTLSVARGDLTLISDLTFTLAAGDMLWIKGGNGIGKTSLLKCCAGVLRPQSGTIFWNDEDITDQASPYAVYQGHDDAHKTELTVLENLEFWQSIYETNTGVQKTLERVGLSHKMDLRAKSLSAGQSRRLALARLLISNAPLWILDEPAAAMDTKGQALIHELLHEHLGRKGSVLLASHGAPKRLGTNTRLLTLTGDGDE
ncbi:MAG: heme ABC exporter ATP-binding protein CcmA [Robiginitomaculum sp.]|nr:MAG: heme ABC exporter ATP-binding protein CcmA [Robiginitomaculum sp.]